MISPDHLTVEIAVIAALASAVGSLEIPDFTLVWQCVTAFAFIGSLLAYRLRRRGRRDVDPFPYIVRWSCVGLAIGLLILAVVLAVR